jgi:MSHA biogenesis protein MshE
MGRVGIGELLKGRGLIGDAHVITALAAQRKSGEPLGEALLGLGLIREDQLLSTLSQQCGVPGSEDGVPPYPPRDLDAFRPPSTR